MFTPRKRSQSDVSMPDLESVKKFYNFSQRVQQDVVNNLKGGFGMMKRALQRRRQKSKAKSARSQKGKAITVAMSNGSGQKERMTKKSAVHRAPRSLKKRVASLEKKTKQAYGHHTYKTCNTLQVSSLVGRCGYGAISLWDSAQIEAALTAVPWLNPAAPSSANNWNATVTLHPTNWTIQAYARVVMRNNYLYPVNIKCYILQPKVDSNVAPDAAILAGVAEEANPSVASTTDFFVQPSDSKQFTEAWKIITSCEMKLQSGDECEVPFSQTVKYDQEFTDDNTETYLKRYSRVLLIRVHGVVCHDSVTTANINFAPTKVDAVRYLRLQLDHPTEAPIKTISVTNGLAAIAANAIVGVASAEVETTL